ncbi:hypothetical protein L202_01844 [Cryptococcus amylolentus CBS 6039]|uniref:Uncharacterized protein n=1 Tax=Cryptococcus amylolentus CBS 6039 TaxID=1295533 RepID=A0A1E3I4Y4_9TREE|nr:hypothetical protein L202_01844 [Cryptococcus amylolentus CBS 6039]ODN83753.1 hypothetical protein L202_01844 [Cryptococcus amylolentus CBS 6039]
MAESANTPSTRSPLSTALLARPRSPLSTALLVASSPGESSKTKDRLSNSEPACDGDSGITVIELASFLSDESSSPPSLPPPPGPARIHRSPPPSYEHSCCSSISSSGTLLIDPPPAPPMVVRGKKNATLEVFSDAHLHTLDDIKLGYQQYVLIAPPSPSFSGRKGKGKKNKKKGKEEGWWLG